MDFVIISISSPVQKIEIIIKDLYVHQ
jgi:hypothetical protein